MSVLPFHRRHLHGSLREAERTVGRTGDHAAVQPEVELAVADATGRRNVVAEHMDHVLDDEFGIRELLAHLVALDVVASQSVANLPENPAGVERDGGLIAPAAVDEVLSLAVLVEKLQYFVADTLAPEAHVLSNVREAPPE